MTKKFKPEQHLPYKKARRGDRAVLREPYRLNSGDIVPPGTELVVMSKLNGYDLGGFEGKPFQDLRLWRVPVYAVFIHRPALRELTDTELHLRANSLTRRTGKVLRLCTTGEFRIRSARSMFDSEEVTRERVIEMLAEYYED